MSTITKQQLTNPNKPLGIKAYGSIPHLLGSKLGPGDHHLDAGQHKILTKKTRDSQDKIIVQEKLDGSCVAIARIGGEIVPLGRAGYLAQSSKYPQHHIFYEWVFQNIKQFDFIGEGDRLCGEWIAQAHGTRYELASDMQPFVAFDWFVSGKRTEARVLERMGQICGFATARIISEGDPIKAKDAYALLTEWPCCRALDPFEGIVYRCERDGNVEFLGKWVRPDKKDGAYFPEYNDGKILWNWWPEWRGPKP